jgi:hypothetical protein
MVIRRHHLQQLVVIANFFYAFVIIVYIILTIGGTNLVRTFSFLMCMMMLSVDKLLEGPHIHHINKQHPENGRTILMEACKDRNSALFEVLWKWGANTLLREKLGRTALDYALSHEPGVRNEYIVEKLTSIWS